MKIDGSAFGQIGASTAAGGGNAAQATNPYDAQIQSLQKKREQYVEKLQKVREETSDPEQAELLAKTYQMAITSIDSRITQLQQAKADEAQRKIERQQAKSESSQESSNNGKVDETVETRETAKPETTQKTEASRDRDDPFALREGEELFWIEDGDRFWPGKKRTPHYPSVAVDISV